MTRPFILPCQCQSILHNSIIPHKLQLCSPWKGIAATTCWNKWVDPDYTGKSKKRSKAHFESIGWGFAKIMTLLTWKWTLTINVNCTHHVDQNSNHIYDSAMCILHISIPFSKLPNEILKLRVVPWLRPCTHLRLVQGLRPWHNPACPWSPQCTGNHS